MSWIEKTQATSFEDQPWPGLFFLYDKLFNTPWARGDKYPMIEFPSGLQCSLWESQIPANPIVHLFGEWDFILFDSRENAYHHAIRLADQLGGVVSEVGEHELEIWGDDGHLLLTYDPTEKRLVNVEEVRVPAGQETRPPRLPLLDAESRAKLPPLYSQEKRGLNAQAVVKFFTPDSNWTWYVSEASVVLDDGSYASLQEIGPENQHIAAILFFGLVIGQEIELGYFTLEELEEARGPLGLPIERDRYFEPTPLKELNASHEQQRGSHA